MGFQPFGNLPNVFGSLTSAAIASPDVPVGGIIMWSGAIADIPASWALCDGTHGTPNLTDRFVVGAGNSYAVGATGGANSVTLTTAQMPSHNHSGPNHNHSSGSLSNSNQDSSHSHNTGTSGSAHTHDGFYTQSGGQLTYGLSFSTGGSSSQSGAVALYVASGILWNTRVTGAGDTSGGATHVAGVRTAGSTHTHNVGNQTSSHSHNISGSTANDGTGNTGNAGSGNSHENRPPYYALAYIMRVS